ncbi:unnamed protein product [Meloidogyne enterolobii]|uniref:Uncharacterized protein n=1 Tax=Meloidogyne enterolobii TaxID=390850 RepID=A0ACB1B340_MELEN
MSSALHKMNFFSSSFHFSYRAKSTKRLKNKIKKASLGVGFAIKKISFHVSYHPFI